MGTKPTATSVPEPPNASVCPNCGHCPTCGRSNHAPVPYIYPQPYRVWPWWSTTTPYWYGTTTVTQGNVSTTGIINTTGTNVIS